MYKEQRDMMAGKIRLYDELATKLSLLDKCAKECADQSDSKLPALHLIANTGGYTGREYYTLWAYDNENNRREVRIDVPGCEEIRLAVRKSLGRQKLEVRETIQSL